MPIGTPGKTILSGPAQNQLYQTVLKYSGILIDFTARQFVYRDPVTNILSQFTTFDGLLAFLGGSVTTGAKWIYNVDGVLVQTSVNTVPQPAYSGARQLIGIRGEYAASKNFLLHSEAFSGGTWTKTGSSVVDNSVNAPTATMIAAALTEDSGTGNHAVSQTITGLSTAANIVSVASAFATFNSGQARDFYIQVDDNAGNGAYVIFPISSGGPPTVFGIGTAFTNLVPWMDPAGASAFTRCSLTYTKNTSATIRFFCGLVNPAGSISYTGDGVSSIAIWGAENKQHTGGAGLQTETAPSSYVRTTTATVTRAADVISLNLPANMRTAVTYTMYVQVTLPRAGAAVAVFASINDAGSQRIYLYQGASPYALLAHIDGTTSTTLTMSPNGVFDQIIGVSMIAHDPTAASNYWVQNSAGGSITSTTANYFTNAVTHIQLGTFDPANTTTGANVGLAQLLLLPVGISRDLAASFLSSDPIVNPDISTPPNYMTQAMLSSVVPASPPYEIFRGPAGLPASDTVAPTSYNYFPLTVAYSGDIKASQSSTFSTAKYAWLQWTNRVTSPVARSYTATISGTTMTVSAVATGFLAPGDAVNGAAPGTTIVQFGTGRGQTGTYIISISQTVSSPTTFSAPSPLTRGATYNSVPGPGLVLSNGHKATLNYSTYLMADIASQIGALYAAGYPAHGTPPPGQTYGGYLDPANAIGLMDSEVLTYDYVGANRDTLFVDGTFVISSNTYANANNLLMLPNGQFGTGTGTAAAYGAVADFEMSDGRPAATTLALVTQLSSIYHNAPSGALKYAINPDPFLSTALFTGLAGVGGPTNHSNLYENFIGDVQSGSTTISNVVLPTCRLWVGGMISGPGIAAGTTIAGLPDSTHITLSVAATSTNPGATLNAQVANLGQIATLVDYVNVLVQEPAPSGYTFNSSVTKYFSMFGTPNVDFPPSHVGIAMIMGTWPGGTTMADATFVHNFIVANGIGGTQTGPTTGQKTRLTIQKWLTLLGLPTS